MPPKKGTKRSASEAEGSSGKKKAKAPVTKAPAKKAAAASGGKDVVIEACKS